jgi:hypothetical protein
VTLIALLLGLALGAALVLAARTPQPGHEQTPIS